ncbi:hypothetical protein [Saccharomonospora xinjiangensis]|uniref:Uncharacterized protein n=1 Tax=Saccharomonospora xinjiangensis XJ-54 TaxID=882086 RepID=I0UX11_9PSEU|nr:hypothetical protein [Saccharomonospora xinjiangensis]EID52414.1 hypothetical protein SacxiDRAFT_0131 [Saccharomonospora xinjiangensis XJ-54]
MSIAPQIPSVRTGPACVQGLTENRIVLADGTAVEILTSYPVRPDADLFSLATAIEFHCADCAQPCEATLVAVRQRWLLCPGCYATLGVVRAPPESQVPDARNAA